MRKIHTYKYGEIQVKREEGPQQERIYLNDGIRMTTISLEKPK